MDKETKEPTDEEIKLLLKELKEQYPEELEDFCFELEVALRIFFDGTVRRDENEIRIYLRDKKKFRIVIEQISKSK